MGRFISIVRQIVLWLVRVLSRLGQPMVKSESPPNVIPITSKAEPEKPRVIKKIVIHCTDSRDSLDIGAAEIGQWHRRRGWLKIGYHFVVRRSGLIERGREENMIGAHVKGYNVNSLGLVWVGRDNCTDDQYQSLVKLTRYLMKKYNLPIVAVVGHWELNSGKTCPNISMVEFRQTLEKEMQ